MKFSKFSRVKKRKRKEPEERQAPTSQNWGKLSQSTKKKCWRKKIVWQSLPQQISHGIWTKSLWNLLPRKSFTSLSPTMLQEKLYSNISWRRKELNCQTASQWPRSLMSLKVILEEMYIFDYLVPRGDQQSGDWTPFNANEWRNVDPTPSGKLVHRASIQPTLNLYWRIREIQIVQWWSDRYKIEKRQKECSSRWRERHQEKMIWNDVSYRILQDLLIDWGVNHYLSCSFRRFIRLRLLSNSSSLNALLSVGF